MEKDKAPELQKKEVQGEQENIWSSGFDGKGSMTLPPPALGGNVGGPVTTNSNETAQLKEEGEGETSTELGRKDEDRARVDLTSNSDSRVYNRWTQKGADSHYADTFHEKFKAQSIAFFGEELTQDQVLAKIEAAKAEGKTEEAESLRKKLFAANQYALVETLDSPDNDLYAAGDGKTYCNIYAYDMVTAMGAYLPRLWWTETTETQIKNGELKDTEITQKYGAGVTREMNANSLNTWMRSNGKEFGWVQAASMQTAQESANSGHVVIILASNANASKSGHVNVILPETEQIKSKEHTDGTTLPVQSQAGSVNFKHDTYSQATTGASNPKWWANSNHKDGAAWICMGNPKSPIMTPDQLGLAPTISKDALAADQDDVKLPTVNAPATTTTNTATNTPVTTENNQPVVTNANTNANTGNTTTPTVAPVTTEEKKTVTPVVDPKKPTTAGTTVNTGEKQQTNVTSPSETKPGDTLHLTHGIMMLATEGDFGGGEGDSRKPTLPENLGFFRKATAEELALWKKPKTKEEPARPKRYGLSTETPNRVFKDKDGAYVEAKRLRRFTASDYDLTPPSGQVIATGPNNSGLTIGMGFDIGARFGTGDKEKAKKELLAAGIKAETADKLSNAVGLRSIKAGKMAAELRASGLTITADQVVNLLNKTREKYIANYTPGVVHEAIEEVMVKINYWKGSGQTKSGGGGKPIVTAIFAAAKEKQGVAQFDAALSVLKNYTEDSFRLFERFLTVVKNQIASGGKVEFDNGVKSIDELTNGKNDTFKVIKEVTGGKKGKDFQKQLTGTSLPESSGLNSKTTTTTSPTKTSETPKTTTTTKASTETPAAFAMKQYKAYVAEQITMVQLAKSMKPLSAGANGEIVSVLMDNLGWTEKDNFAYALVSNSSEGELKGFNVALLGKLSEALDTWATFSFDANATQKARVDAVRSGIAFEAMKAKLQKMAEAGQDPKKVKKDEKKTQAAAGYIYGPLLSTGDWVSQANPADYPNINTLKPGELNASSYGVACYDCCVAMLKRKGFPTGTNNTTLLQDLKADGKATVPPGAMQLGLSKIDAKLAAGQPVIVGVDKGEATAKYHGHTQSDTKANKGRATDHWVVIHGKGTDANGNTFYVYYDPARYNTEGGTSLANNRFIVNTGTERIHDNNAYSSYQYSISDVRD
ncbi:MAG: hypothetical protein IPN95_24590 [Bacteroidetes bacterium]|nr:hypothetical protein [Bacteroidota bacterium]